MSLELYKNRLKAYKVEGKEGKIEDIKKRILDNFESNLSYYEVLINNIERKVLIVSDKNNQYKVLCKPNDDKIKNGDTVVWGNKNFLCVGIEENDTVQSAGFIQKCNNTLTFQDPNTLEIHTLPCTLQDKTSVYSDGIYQNPYLTLADDQILITVPNNDITNKIVTNMRFIFDHDEWCIYKCTKIDKLTQKGLIKFVMKHDTYIKAKDNLELNIADYKEILEEPEPPEPLNPESYKIELDLSYNEVIFNTFETCNVKVYFEDEEIDGEITFEIIGDNTILWLENIQHRQCNIKAGDKPGGVILRVSLKDDENIYEEVEIKAVAW